MSHGADPDMVWALQADGIDPVCLHDEAPLIRYHRELWFATYHFAPGDAFSRWTIVEYFEIANNARAWETDLRKRARDPLSRAVYAAFNVGWFFHNAFMVDDGRGTLLNLVAISP